MPAAPQTKIARDTAVAAAAGYIGGTVMEQINMQTFQRLEPEEDRQREQEVRPGPLYVASTTLTDPRSCPPTVAFPWEALMVCARRANP